MVWADDSASLDADIIDSDGFGEPVTWPDNTQGVAILSMRQDQRLFEVSVSEPTWTIQFRRSDYSPARGETMTARFAQWRFGERIDGADDYMDVWSIQKL